MSRPSSGTCAYLPCFLAPWLTSLFQTPIFWSYSSHLFNPTSLFPDPAITVSSWPTISFPDLLHYLLHPQGRLSPYFYLGPTVTPRHAPERLQVAECTKLSFFIHLYILMSGVVYDVSFLTTNWIKLIFTVCVLIQLPVVLPCDFCLDQQDGQIVWCHTEDHQALILMNDKCTLLVRIKGYFLPSGHVFTRLKKLVMVFLSSNQTSSYSGTTVLPLVSIVPAFIACCKISLDCWKSFAISWLQNRLTDD